MCLTDTKCLRCESIFVEQFGPAIQEGFMDSPPFEAHVPLEDPLAPHVVKVQKASYTSNGNGFNSSFHARFPETHGFLVNHHRPRRFAKGVGPPPPHPTTDNVSGLDKGVKVLLCGRHSPGTTRQGCGFPIITPSRDKLPT
jgi:hypothetical protein